MNNVILRLTVLATVLFASCNGPVRNEQEAETNVITFREDSAGKKVDVLIDGKMFTSYQWPDSVYKPILYPILSPAGNLITRGFPLEPRPDEKHDHRHQVGNWLNYGNVNGFDFWGNGHSGEKLPKGGVIVHKSIDGISPGTARASLASSADWVDAEGRVLLTEETQFHFSSRDSIRVIDRITKLTARVSTVTFSDTKEGMFALRVARELELPSKQESGVAQPVSGRQVATGNYRSSEGITGEAVWSTRARWMALDGMLGDEAISVIVCDHPNNLNYPTWWHARGYGLLSANPLGAKDFTKGEVVENHSLSSGDTLVFRYRIILASGAQLTTEQINELSNEFSKEY